MKTKLHSIAILLLAFATSTTFAQITFQQGVCPSDCSVEGLSIQQANDGGYIACGNHGSGGSASYYIVKTDNTGNIVWSKEFTASSGSIRNAVKQTYDNGYVVVGNVLNILSASSLGDAYIVKFNAAGNVQWAKAFGDSTSDFAYSVALAADSGLVVTGSKTNAAGNSVYLVKFSKTGTLVWSYVFDTAVSNALTEGDNIQTTDDGGFVIAGITDAGFWNNPPYDFLIKTDSNGILQWSHAYRDSLAPLIKYNTNVQQTPNGYIVSGNRGTQVTGYYDAYMFTTNIAGAPAAGVYWDIDEDDRVYSPVITHPDLGYSFIGTAAKFGQVQAHGFMLKMNSSLNFQWARIYNPDFNLISDGHETNDGGYILTGRIGLGGFSQSVYMVKTNVNGETFCADSSVTPAIISFSPTDSANVFTQNLVPTTVADYINVIDSLNFNSVFCLVTSISETMMNKNKEINIFPNPFSNQITFAISDNEPTTVSLYDLLSQPILQHTFINQATLNTEQLAAGIYFYQLRNDKGTVKTGKIVKQ